MREKTQSDVTTGHSSTWRRPDGRHLGGGPVNVRRRVMLPLPDDTQARDTAGAMVLGMSPMAPSKSCLTPRCSGMASYRGRCARCAAGHEQGRPNADVRRWYRTTRWTTLRAIVLREEPACCDCAAIGKSERSTDADHQGTPPRGCRAVLEPNESSGTLPRLSRAEDAAWAVARDGPMGCLGCNDDECVSARPDGAARRVASRTSGARTTNEAAARRTR